MSLLKNPAIDPADLPPPENPYLYGWREREEILPDGSRVAKRTPLTRLDVLHPQMEDTILESNLHDIARSYLRLTMQSKLASDAMSLVLSDVVIFWDHPAIKQMAPDVAVLFGVKDRDREWPSYDVAEEGVLPSLVVEVVSPHVRKNDVEDKLELYHQLEIPMYVILDREYRGQDWTVRAYEYQSEGWKQMLPDNKSLWWLESVGMWLGTEGQRVFLIDGLTQEEVRSPLEEKMRAIAAEKKASRAELAEAKARRAQAKAEEKAKELERQLEELKKQLPRSDH